MNPCHRPLSRSRKAIVFTALCAAIWTILYPPWVYTINPPNRRAVDKPARYALLWEPPTYGNFGVRPDWGRLVLQWLLITVSAAAAALVLPASKNDPRNGEEK